jgi:hypothetical protein
MTDLINYINEAFNDAKNGDEFYTRIEDIENGLSHFNFSGKIIYCNCDDPSFSNFYKYFHDNYSKLGIKKLMATYYSDKPELVEYDGKNEKRTPIKSGRFQDNQEYMKQCDIVVTNPPYSDNMPFELIELCYKNNCNFIFVGPLHLCKTKKAFKYIKDNKLFSVPASVNKFLTPDGSYKNAPACWYTSIEVEMPKHKFTHKYDKESNPKYDNYDAIECKKSSDIPEDYDGLIGVPYRFFSRFNREQFELVDVIIPKLNGKTLMDRYIIKIK